MKSIALIHTVKSVASGFDDSLRNYLGSVSYTHLTLPTILLV